MSNFNIIRIKWSKNKIKKVIKNLITIIYFKKVGVNVMASNIVNFPYNFQGVARLDSNGVVHNHLYHECPIGRIDADKIIHNHHLDNSPVGRVDESGVVHSHHVNNSPVGRVDNNGYIHNHHTDNSPVGRVDGDNANLAGSAYLLLLHGKR